VKLHRRECDIGHGHSGFEDEAHAQDACRPDGARLWPTPAGLTTKFQVWEASSGECRVRPTPRGAFVRWRRFPMGIFSGLGFRGPPSATTLI
jgi:hypothetical protein